MITANKLFMRCFAFLILAAVLGIQSLSAYSVDMMIKVNDQPIKVIVKVIDKKSYISLKALLNSLKWSVKWDPGTRTVTARKGISTIVLKAGSAEAIVNGAKVILDMPPIIIDGVTYVQDKFIAQQFGKKVQLDRKENLVILSDDNTRVNIKGNRNIVVEGNGIIVDIYEPYTFDTANDMRGVADHLLINGQIEDSIYYYKDILENITKEKNPDIYSHVLINMGNAYSLMSERKDTKENISQSISLYQEALKLYSSKTQESIRADTYINLGTANRVLAEITGIKSYTYEALTDYREALKFFENKGSLIDCAGIYYNMGLAYRLLDMKEMMKENLKRAEQQYEKSLDIYTLDCNPVLNALIKFNLGDIYALELDTADSGSIYFEKAKAAYEDVIKEWTAESYPILYAKVRKSLGDMYQRVYKSSHNRQDLTLAIDEYTESLKFFSLEEYPVYYGRANLELGNSYSSLTSLKYDSKLEENAAKRYKEALKALDAEDNPVENNRILNRLKQIEKTIDENKVR